METGAFNQLEGLQFSPSGILSGIPLPNHETHFYSAPCDTRQDLFRRGEKPILEPIPCVCVPNANDVSSIFVGEKFRIANPSVVRGTRHFELELA
jgi:hypothetical protein